MGDKNKNQEKIKKQNREYVNTICDICKKDFKNTSNLKRHLGRKKPCSDKINELEIEEYVEDINIIKEIKNTNINMDHEFIKIITDIINTKLNEIILPLTLEIKELRKELGKEYRNTYESNQIINNNQENIEKFMRNIEEIRTERTDNIIIDDINIDEFNEINNTNKSKKIKEIDKFNRINKSKKNDESRENNKLKKSDILNYDKSIILFKNDEEKGKECENISDKGTMEDIVKYFIKTINFNKKFPENKNIVINNDIILFKYKNKWVDLENNIDYFIDNFITIFDNYLNYIEYNTDLFIEVRDFVLSIMDNTNKKIKFFKDIIITLHK